MAETTSLINEPGVDFHLKLNQHSFNIPYEQLQRNSRYLNRLIEKEIDELNSHYERLNIALGSGNIEGDKKALQELKDIIRSVEIFEKRLQKRVNEEVPILKRLEVRINFFKELENAKQQVADITPLMEWYQKFTNILIGDYLTRHTTSNSSPELGLPGVTFLEQEGIQDLLDTDILLTGNRISTALVDNHDLRPLLDWINDSKSYLKKNGSRLEFEARFQQYIELLKASEYEEAIKCFQDYLLKFVNTNFNELTHASGLLLSINYCKEIMKAKASERSAILTKDDGNPLENEIRAYKYFFHKKPKIVEQQHVKPVDLRYMNLSQNTDFEKYMLLLDDKRWGLLNELFLKDYYSLYGISQNDPLLIYLSLGISTLKTRECLHHRRVAKSSSPLVDKKVEEEVLQNSCPVCDKTFAPIAESLPFAHHTQSQLFDDPIMLPNGNIYEAKRLKRLAKYLVDIKAIELGETEVIDPIDKQIYNEADFITMYPT
ncbi:C-terminal to LisH (CTLH) motif profile [Nakaseomyces glabratus]|nr:GID complex subunit containing RING finger motif [Nakaseomyces glabratus]